MSIPSWYYFWIIPSSISFVLSVLMVGNIWLMKLVKHPYHRFSLIYALTDMLQCGSWFLGTKYQSGVALCSVQEYMYQSGTLFKSLSLFLINISLFNIIIFKRTGDANNSPKFALYVFLLGAAAIVISVLYNSAGLFCDDVHTNGRHHSNVGGSQTSLIAYFIVYVVPVYVCYAVNVVGTVAILKEFFRIDPSLMLPTFKRMVPYTVAYTLAIVPSCIYFFAAESRQMRNVASLGISCTGIVVALGYFYFCFVDRVVATPERIHSVSENLSNPLFRRESLSLIDASCFAGHMWASESECDSRTSKSENIGL